nr:uncharacterized protein LOC109741552 isoform X2 [Aegilops tauschii subsp. strangulata]
MYACFLFLLCLVFRLSLLRLFSFNCYLPSSDRIELSEVLRSFGKHALYSMVWHLQDAISGHGSTVAASSFTEIREKIIFWKKEPIPQKMAFCAWWPSSPTSWACQPSSPLRHRRHLRPRHLAPCGRGCRSSSAGAAPSTAVSPPRIGSSGFRLCLEMVAVRRISGEVVL